MSGSNGNRKPPRPRIEMRFVREKYRLAEAPGQVRLQGCDRVPVQPLEALGPSREARQLGQVPRLRDHQTAVLHRAGKPFRPIIERLCAERGMRMTGQRRVIAKVLSEADDHPDVEEVYRRASARDPRISLSTVYRTVRLFEGAGILERHEFGAGRRARYEPAGHGHHDHLINVDTGEVIEFKNEQIERLQEIVAQELGYNLIGHRLELFGTPLPAGPHKNRKS